MLVVCGFALAVEAAGLLQLIVMILDAFFYHQSMEELTQSISWLVASGICRLGGKLAFGVLQVHRGEARVDICHRNYRNHVSEDGL